MAVVCVFIDALLFAYVFSVASRPWGRLGCSGIIPSIRHWIAAKYSPPACSYDSFWTL